MSRRLPEIPASVSIDGEVLKRIREEKRLTQLYVSKVVGVTTDTISRWENNRYPTVRRENVLKLAEALEVDVDALLRKSPVEAEPVPPSPTNWWPLVIGTVSAVVALTALLLMLLHQIDRSPAPAIVTAERVLPNFAAPGTTIPVQIRLTQRSDQSGFILREYLPKGWKLLQSSPPASSLDNDNGMVRWIVKTDDARDGIVYLVQVDRLARRGSDGIFQGEVVAGSGSGQSAVPVQGEGRIVVAPVLWADLNGDGRIDDGEMLQASYTVDEMAGVQIDWFELERLWNAGGYRWDDQTGKFLPVKQVDPSAGSPSR
jgi:transcriptional regulator with XRE-family HTH domain